MGVEPKLGGFYPPKMDGENNGKPYEQMDDFGGKPIFLGWHPNNVVIEASKLMFSRNFHPHTILVIHQLVIPPANFGPWNIFGPWTLGIFAFILWVARLAGNEGPSTFTRVYWRAIPSFPTSRAI